MGVRWRLDPLLLLAAKAAVSWMVVAGGFRAISDDDFARVVIAERFAVSPALDPSGTSWLPFPFWLTGGLMAGFGRGLEVARALAVTQGYCAVLLVYAAALVWGIPRRGALIAALIAGSFPYAAWTGVATVPEGLTAALLVFGCAGLTGPNASLGCRSAGSVALLLASLSRYEAWPFLLICVAFALKDAHQRRSPRDWALALLPLVGPLGWMLNGFIHHGDPWFFVTRVAAYKRALGSPDAAQSGAALERALGVFLGVLRYEPELVALTVVAGLIAAFGRWTLFSGRRLLTSVTAVLLFLALGELGAAGPTHHGERAVMVAWLGCSLVLGTSVDQIFRLRRAWVASAALGTGAALAALVAWGLRPSVTKLGSFADRLEEESIGLAARKLSGEETLWVDTPDYGFFAIMAAFGEPSRVIPLDDRDPRRPRPADPFRSRAALRGYLRQNRAHWLVSQGTRCAMAAELGSVRSRTSRLCLVELPLPARSGSRTETAP